IAPLQPESADALLQALVGENATLQPLQALLIPRTGGNPFFLEETVRTLVETGVLVGESGSYQLAKEPRAHVPSTVQAVLAARIDRLPPEAKRFLQSASVIGHDVPFSLLEAIADVPRQELAQCLMNLQGGEFLYEAQLFPHLEYTFKHALTHEVAYGSLLNERRRSLHTRVVEAIERLHSGRVTEQIERLAHHSYKGEVWEKAVSYSRQPGTKCAMRNAPRGAVVWFEQALDALQHCVKDTYGLEQAI